MNLTYKDPKMRHITKCPHCKENYLDIQLQDDEDILEIESSRLSKFGGDYTGESFQCENCGCHYVTKKKIEIKQEVERQEAEKRRKEEEKKRQEEQLKERRRLAYEAKRKEIEEEQRKRNERIRIALKEERERWAKEEEEKNNRITVNVIKESVNPINSQKIFSVFYITPITNLLSILKHGILSHNELEKSNIQYEAEYNKAIMKKRQSKRLEYGKNLFHWCNAYFKKKTPMYYRVKQSHSVVVLEIQLELNQPGIYVTDKNAAVTQEDVKFYDCQYIKKETIEEIQEIAQTADTRIVDSSGWRDEKANPVVQAECLIKDKIPPQNIQSVHAQNYKKFRNLLDSLGISNFKPITYDL